MLMVVRFNAEQLTGMLLPRNGMTGCDGSSLHSMADAVAPATKPPPFRATTSPLARPVQ